MSILIKGMEMPCEEVEPMHIELYADGTVIVIKEQDDFYEFEAVPVPPHGRLVDADKLMQEMRLFIKENMLSRDDARELLETIEDAPTVLEAEEGE